MSLLDEETIATLKEVLEDEFDALIDTFLGDAPKRVTEMRACVAANDHVALETPAHTLKGSSGNVGAMELFSLCEQLVKEIRAGSVNDAAGQVEAIAAKLSETETAMIQLKRS